MDEEMQKQDGAPSWAKEMLNVLMDIKRGVSAAKMEADSDEMEKGSYEEAEEILNLQQEEEDKELKSVPTTVSPDDSDFPQTPQRPPAGDTTIRPPRHAAEEEDEDDKEDKKKKKSAPYEVGVSQAAMSAFTDTIKSLQKEVALLKAEQRIEKKAAQLSASGLKPDKVKRFKETFKKHGEVAAKVYADTVQELNPELPPRHFTGELSYGEKADTSVVSAYAQKGPEALERARSLQRSFEKTKPEMSLERYLQINMDPDAFFASARSSVNKGA